MYVYMRNTKTLHPEGEVLFFLKSKQALIWNFPTENLFGTVLLYRKEIGRLLPLPFFATKIHNDYMYMYTRIWNEEYHR